MMRLLDCLFSMFVFVIIGGMFAFVGALFLAMSNELEQSRLDKQFIEYTATCPDVEFKFKRTISGGVMYNVRSDGMRINSIPDVCVITSRRIDQ